MYKEPKYKKREKLEWSKIIATILIIYGISSGILYYIAIFNDKIIDSAVAVQSIITIMGAFGQYLLYQASLKVSRNRHGIDSNGTPFCINNKTDSNNVDVSLDNGFELPLMNEKE